KNEFLIYCPTLEGLTASCACANISDTKRPFQTLIPSPWRQQFRQCRAPSRVRGMCFLEYIFRKFLTQELRWVDEHYALLCDFVHPNMSSQRTAGSLVGNPPNLTDTRARTR